MLYLSSAALHINTSPRTCGRALFPASNLLPNSIFETVDPTAGRIKAALEDLSHR